MDSSQINGVEEKRSTTKQIILGLIAFFSSIAPSMSLGFSAIAIPALISKSNPYRMTGEQSSWIASVASIATPIGCFLSGPLSDRLGRKTALHAVNIITLSGWLLIGIAYNAINWQYSLLIIGRLLTGLSTGFVSASPSVYMAEVSSTKLRGVFTTSSGAFFSLGVLIIYILGYILKDDWGTAAFITAGFPVTSLILCVLFLPESPVWLVSKNRVDEARTNMHKIYGENCKNMVSEDLEFLIKSRQKNGKVNKSESKSFLTSFKSKLKYLMQPTCLKPFIIMTCFFLFQQLSGSFVVIFYAIDIVEEAGVTIDPYLAIVLIAVTRFIGAIIVTFVSKNLGRRPTSILSGAFMTLSMAALSIYLLLAKQDFIGNTNGLSWIPLLLLIVYFFTSTLGFLTIPFAMVAEVYPAKVRGLASGLTVCSGYIFNFFVVKIYPSMATAMNNYGIFAFYGAMSLLGTIFVLIFLPETRGRTLQEIEDLFVSKKKIINETQEETKILPP